VVTGYWVLGVLGTGFRRLRTRPQGALQKENPVPRIERTRERERERERERHWRKRDKGVANCLGLAHQKKNYEIVQRF